MLIAPALARAMLVEGSSWSGAITPSRQEAGRDEGLWKPAPQQRDSEDRDLSAILKIGIWRCCDHFDYLVCSLR
jgi:hypothetical protein